MFTLPFYPDFAGIRRRILLLREAPETVLPADLRRVMALMEKVDPGRLAAFRSGGSRMVWRSCVGVSRNLLLLTASASVITAAAAAAAAVFGMWILASEIPPLAAMLALAAGMFAMNAISQVGAFVTDRLRIYAGLTVDTHLVGLISTKLLTISPRRRILHSSGSLKILVTSDARNVGQFFDNLARNLIPSIVGLAVIAPFLIHLSGWSGVLGIVSIAAIAPIAAGLSHVTARLQVRSQGELDTLAALAGEWVKNLRLIRFLSWNPSFEKDVSESVRRYTSVAILKHFMDCLTYGLSQSWWMIAVAGVTLTSRYTGDVIAVVPFFGSMWLIGYLSTYFTHIPNTMRLYAIAYPSVLRIAHLLSEEDQAESFIDGTLPARSSAERVVRVECEDLTFRYGATSPPVLKHLTLSLNLNEKTAILGEVGSGKTTFLQLLCGELVPTEGHIRIGLESGSAYDLWIEGMYHRFRATIGYVPQEAYVSNDRLDSNITLDDAPDDDVVLQSLALAELESDIALLAGGIHQEIGENGVNLSGGQRQRVNLARAFYSRRPFLVMDDTLSAVDTGTERILMERLAQRSGGLVLVTHRVNELLRMDRVLIFRDGGIVEDGDPRILTADPHSQLNRVLMAYEAAAGVES